MKKVTRKENEILNTLGKRIADERTRTGMSQQDLADKLVVKREKINYIENDTRKPSIDELEQIANIFNISTDYLLCRVNSRGIENLEISKQICLDDTSIDYLKVYCKDDYTKSLLKYLLENEEFMTLLAEYFITSNIERIVAEDSKLYFFFLLLTDYQFIGNERKSNFADILEILPSYKLEIKEKIKKSDYKSLAFRYFIANDFKYLHNRYHNEEQINSRLERAKTFIDSEIKNSNIDSKIYEELKKLLKGDIGVVKDIGEEYQKYKEKWDKISGNKELIKISNNSVTHTTIRI